MKIYGISGLGADKRVFEKLTLDLELIPIDWIPPYKNEKIEDYANRLSEIIDKNEEFIILGVSFGGLIATEISKISKPRLTILISSAETKNDLRFIYRTFSKTNLINFVPKKAFDFPRAIASFLFRTEEKELLSKILDDTDLDFTKWAVKELINWKNETEILNCIKINGDNDKLIPASKDEKTILIKGGGHFMIVDKAKEISEIINDKIK